MCEAEQVVTYRELVRLQMRLSDEAAAYQNEIQALVVVLFPEFTQIFVDPCGQTALTVLKASPLAQAVAEAGVEPLFQLLRARDPGTRWPPDCPEARGCGQSEWKQWASTRLPEQSVCACCAINSSIPRPIWPVWRPRSSTSSPLIQESKGENLSRDVALRRWQSCALNEGMRSVLHDTLEVIAYGGMDIEIKESGRWKGQAKLSKRGSGPARDACSTWPLCAAFLWKVRCLELTHSAWWHAASTRGQL